VSRTNPRVVVPTQGILGDDPASMIKRVRVLAKLLDNSLTVPGLGWQFGIDAIIGLIPVIGDMIGGVLASYIVLEAARAKVSSFTLARMLMNVGIDTVLGSVPAVGDLFDAAWKANIKNVALLERHLVAGTVADREKRSVAGAIVLAVIVLLVILAAGLALGIFAVRLLWGLWTR
jgi:Domain of unknown function (DUF4112)